MKSFDIWQGALAKTDPCPACSVVEGEKHKKGCGMKKALELESRIGEPDGPTITLVECAEWLKKLYPTLDGQARQNDMPPDVHRSLMMYGFISNTIKN